MIDISSSHNVHFKQFQSLLSSKGIKQEQMFLLSGQKLIQEIPPHLELLAEILGPDHHLATKAPKQYRLSAELFRELDALGTHYNLVAVKTPPLEQVDASFAPKERSLLIPLGDPSNLGALLRSAEAFGIKSIVLTTEAANPFLPKAIKASSGSVLRLKLYKTCEFKKWCEQRSDLMALDMKGANIADFAWPKHGILAVGEEGPGLPATFSGQKLSIPTQNVESLNATVATSIALYNWSQR